MELELLQAAARLESEGQWLALLQFSKRWTVDDPNSQLAWQSMGNALRKLGKLEEAIPAYLKGIEVTPAYPLDYMGGVFSAGPLWFSLGSIYSEIGNHEKAIEAFLEAAKINPNVVDIWNDLGMVYINKTPQDIMAAYEAFINAINVDPKNIIVLKNLGVVYAMCGREDGVKQVHQALSDLDNIAAADFLQKANGLLIGR